MTLLFTRILQLIDEILTVLLEYRNRYLKVTGR